MSWLDVAPGCRLRYSDRTPDGGETARPVVLVHGWKQSHRLYDRLAIELVARGHRVVRYDSRGMGESDKPDEAYDFGTLAADLGRVIAHSGVEDATLFGWSMGCTVSLEHLATASAGIGRVVLHNGPLRLVRAPDFPHAMPPEQLDGYLQGMVDAWPGSEREFQRESILPESPEGLLEFLVSVALQTPLDIAVRLCRQQALIDHRENIGRLPVPVLAAYSDRDPYYPVSLAEWIAETAPDGHLAILKGSAHGAALEEPAALAAVIDQFEQDTIMAT